MNFYGWMMRPPCFFRKLMIQSEGREAEFARR
jgi:hypothetical protein